MSIEDIRKRYLFRENGILKGKELDPEAELPRLNICSVPPPPPAPSQVNGLKKTATGPDQIPIDNMDLRENQCDTRHPSYL